MNQINKNPQNKQVYVYDIETLLKCFTLTAYNIDTKQVVQFVLHKDRFELLELVNHLLHECKGQIGYNNLNFDYPVIHYILQNWVKWTSYDIGNEQIILDIYYEAQRLIENQDRFGNSIKENEVIIPQMDLFKIWHYDNIAKLTSLKKLEISMNYPNVMDMPIKHDDPNIELNQIDEILA